MYVKETKCPAPYTEGQEEIEWEERKTIDEQWKCKLGEERTRIAKPDRAGFFLISAY